MEFSNDKGQAFAFLDFSDKEDLNIAKENRMPIEEFDFEGSWSLHTEHFSFEPNGIYRIKSGEQ